jgi:putative two-component system response regulator
MSFAVVRESMAAEGGRHFDPDLLQAFLDNFEAFCDIARLHPDEAHEPHQAQAKADESAATIVA